MFAGLLKPGTLVMIVLAIVIGIYLYYLEKKTKSSRSAALCKQYAVMTDELLASVADDTLVEAIIANLMSRQDRRRPDPAADLPFLSRGRAAVYSVWLLYHEMADADCRAFFASPSQRFAEDAVEGLEMLGAEHSADALRAACAAAAEAADNTPWDTLTADLRRALAEEEPLKRCVPYIRVHADEFVD